MGLGRESSNANNSASVAWEFASGLWPVESPALPEIEPNSSPVARRFPSLPNERAALANFRASAVASIGVHVGVGTRSRAFGRHLSRSTRPHRLSRGR